MRHVDLFSGILGFSLAAEWVWGDEYELVLCCESDPFCQKVIRKHRPGVPIVEDVRDVEEIISCVEYVQNVKKEKLPQIKRQVERWPIANHAKPNANNSGSKRIEKNIKKAKESGAGKRKRKLSDTMVGNAFVVEKIQSSFSPLTTSSTMETLKDENINHKHGSSQSREGCQ